jgi:hypothetical protein
MACRPATAGILRSAVVALEGAADELGDAGDEEAALVLDHCGCRARRIIKARYGPPPTQDRIAAAAAGLLATALALEEAGDPEASGLFGRAAEALAAILDGRRGPPPRHLGRAIGLRNVRAIVKAPKYLKNKGKFCKCEMKNPVKGERAE